MNLGFAFFLSELFTANNIAIGRKPAKFVFEAD